MKERRKYQRFTVGLPAEVETLDVDEKEKFSLVTCDISAGGVYFRTGHVIPEGKQAKIQLSVLNEKLKQLTGLHGWIQVDGTVVRSGSIGMAICFGGECQLFGLTGSETSNGDRRYQEAI
ncbi:MAG: PilZ domain-containing protein [Deltaproteobacteria bacterium]|nr:MAG: PilZ domain-containing protein [Deltaproteobacteria bacterium]